MKISDKIDFFKNRLFSTFYRYFEAWEHQNRTRHEKILPGSYSEIFWPDGKLIGARRRSKIGKFCLNLLCLSLDVVSQPRLVLTDTYFDVSSGRGRSLSSCIHCLSHSYCVCVLDSFNLIFVSCRILV